MRGTRGAALVMAGLCFAAAAVGSASTVATSAAGRPAPRAVTAGAIVRIRPAMHHVGRASRQPLTTAQCEAQYAIACYGATQLQRAYDLPALFRRGVQGRHQTIVIVDPFGSPTIARDLREYDTTYHLPAPPSLRVIRPAGTFQWQANDTDEGWAGETTLDVEVAHTVAPGAKIVLIETPVSETEGLQGFPQIIQAENAVISGRSGGAAYPKVDVLSQSFAATEQTFTDADQIRGLSQSVYPAAKAAGVTVLSSSGDNGPVDYKLDVKTLYDTPVTDWPASDPLVTAVGGTTLDLDAHGGRQGPDSAWGGSGAAGGGLSTVFPRPAFQSTVAGVATTGRGVPDIALDADPGSGLITYGSFDGGGYSVGGGTSQAAPLMAGIVALADQMAGARVGYLNDALYALARTPDGGIVDVTRGSNDCSCSRVPGYRAVAGYDLASGLGTIDGGRFVPALVAARKGATQPFGATGGAASSASPSGPSGTSSAGSSPSPSSPPGPVASAPVAAKGSGGSSKAVLGTVAAVLLVVVAGAGGWALRRRRGRPPVS